MAADLRRELRQQRPFESREQEAHLSVIRTAACLADDADRLLKPFGLTAAQYNVLRILRGAGGDGLCRNDLRSRLLTRMPDVTRLLDRMERAGLVVRRRGSAGDRREVRAQISERGLALLGELDAVVAREHKRRFAGLRQAEIRTLVDLLGRLRD